MLCRKKTETEQNFKLGELTMSKKDNKDLVYFNGIDAETGGYLFPPVKAETLVKNISDHVLGEEQEPDELEKNDKSFIKKLVDLFSGIHFGTQYDFIDQDVTKAGWGVVVAKNLENKDKVLNALAPLIEYRKKQVGSLYKEFIYDVEKDTEFARWMYKYGVVADATVEPEKMPFYLLLIGSLEEIPFKFQYLLDGQYAVGRIHFDSVEDYAKYAKQVVENESKEFSPKEATIFGTKHDTPTTMSEKYMLKPIIKGLRKDFPEWKLNTILGSEATKDNLVDIIHSDNPPSLLFTATHGTFEKSNPSDCGIYFSKNSIFNAGSIKDDADLKGMIAFIFACYSGAVPHKDNFPNSPDSEAKVLSESGDVLSNLPKRLLTAGASAVIVHMDRSFIYSFYSLLDVLSAKRSYGGYDKKELLDNDNRLDTATFEGVIGTIFYGKPIGYSTRLITAKKFQSLSNYIANRDLDRDEAKEIDLSDEEIATNYIVTKTLRNYFILGDPASHL